MGYIGQVADGEIQVSEGKRAWNKILSVKVDPIRFRSGWWNIRERTPFGAWYREAVLLMQGQSTLAQNLRFEWTPVLVWKTRPDDSLQAILFGWSKSLFFTLNQHGTGPNGIVIAQEVVQEYVFEYYYDEPQKQRIGDNFNEWLCKIYDNDKPYFQHALWIWVEEAFNGEFKGLYQSPI